GAPWGRRGAGDGELLRRAGDRRGLPTGRLVLDGDESVPARCVGPDVTGHFATRTRAVRSRRTGTSCEAHRLGRAHRWRVRAGLGHGAARTSRSRTAPRCPPARGAGG